MPNNYPREALELINFLCTYNPDLRITAHRALKHRYFNYLREMSRDSLKQTPTEGATRVPAIPPMNGVVTVQTQPQEGNARNVGDGIELYKPIYKKNPNVNKLYMYFWLKKNVYNCCFPILSNNWRLSFYLLLSAI